MRIDRPGTQRIAIAAYLAAYLLACLLVLALAMTLPLAGPNGV